ncbi:MAG: Nif3-like dinuclear metal center hexameric protein [Magnetococcales bacterium]|nr:Nif3-like dinuclear metal center hexameric protein [Magnetococcales bacterium]
MVPLKKMATYLDHLLQVHQFVDYCPNGIQVQGRKKIKKMVTGVSACTEIFQAARDQKADLILVHHGLFWEKDTRAIQGLLRQRLRLLMKHNLTLMAFHLPLDAHPKLGNNIGLLRLLGAENPIPFGHYHNQTISFMGHFAKPISIERCRKMVEKKLNPASMQVFPYGPNKIRRVAVCSGGAPELIREAKEQGADLFLTGEANEPLYYFAREQKIHCIAAGHHATETLGVRALGNHLAEKFDLKHEFYNTFNPL